MTELTKSAYARHRGVSPGYVTKLAEHGRLVITAAGLVDVEASDRLIEQTAGNRTDVAERNATARGAKRAQNAQGAISHSKAGRDIGAPTKPAPSAKAQAGELSKDKEESTSHEKIGSSYQAARSVKEKYAALKAKAEYETMIGDLIPREDVDTAMRFIGGAVRAAFDVFPDQTAPLVSQITDITEIHEIITQSARDALNTVGASITRQRSALKMSETVEK